MFASAPGIAAPEGTATVWRYMDLARFVSLLNTSSMFFAQAGLMADRWEGSLGISGIPMSDENRRRNLEASRKTTYLSCWHASEYESVAMWDIYQREGRGIAIRTTWAALTGSITSPWPITGGFVNYVDPRYHLAGLPDRYAPFMLKRKSFEHEREARLILWGNAEGGPDERRGRVESIEGDIFYNDQSTARAGYSVPVDVRQLIDWVYVPPDSPTWIEETVTAMIGRYGFEFPVVKSNLYSDPLEQPF